MKKNKMVFLILMSALLLGQAVYAEVDYEDYSVELENNSNVIKVLDLNILNMEIDKRDAEVSSRSTEKTLNQFDRMGFSFPSETEANMKYGVLIAPLQVEYGLYSLTENRRITQNTLTISSRMLALSIIQEQNNVNLYQEQLNFYESELNRILLQYDLGNVTQTDILSAEVDLNSSKVNLETSLRKLDNSIRSFNQLLGIDLDREVIIKIESQILHDMKNEEYYLDLALNNRYEIKDLKKQYELELQTSELYGSKNYSDYDSLYKALRRSENNLVVLESKLNRIESEVSIDIYNALNQINITNAQIVQLESTLQIQLNSLSVMQAQYEAGYITESVMKQLEFAIASLEGNLEVLYYNYNTQRYKLENATAQGPAFGGIN